MSSQQSLTDSVSGALRRPGGWNVIQRIKNAVTDVADDIGVPIDYFTSRPADLPDDAGVIRYQHSTVYEFVTRGGGGQRDDYTPIGSVQFRTTFYTLTPPSDEVKQYLRNINHRRLHTLFNSGVYDDYMEGFSFIGGGIDADHSEEDRPVAADEIPPTGLGVPNFAVEVYGDDGKILGHSKGYSLDFGVTQTQVRSPDAPRGEVWRLGSLNKARNDYELKPKAKTAARERARNAAGKVVYVNGMPIGTITSRGTVWFSREHKSPSRATYASRKQVIESTGTPYQAIQPGTKFYKVREDADTLAFSTTRPVGFDEARPENLDPQATGLEVSTDALSLVDDDPTTFVVTTDVADDWALGKYDPIVQREIELTTDFATHHGT